LLLLLRAEATKTPGCLCPDILHPVTYDAGPWHVHNLQPCPQSASRVHQLRAAR
jgi:hypothetical protein